MYIDKIPDNAVKIRGALDYVDENGYVYGIESRNKNRNIGRPFIKTQSTVHGYKYCGIKYENGNVVSKRVHRLVAEAFIPNENNLPIVMHKNNNKADNNVSNLQWGTAKDNTKQAVDDGLLVNDSSWDDSQSVAVDQYDTITNELINSFGSVSEAERKTGITMATILFQCKNRNEKIRKSTYFVFHNDPPIHHDIVVAYNMDDNAEVKRFANTRFAEEFFNTSHVADRILRGKPKWSSIPVWFSRVKI